MAVSVRTKGDQKLASEFIPHAKAELERLRARLKTENVKVLRDTIPYQDGVTFLLLVTDSGVESITIHAAPPGPNPLPEYDDSNIKLLCGVIKEGYLEEVIIEPPAPAEPYKLKRLNDYWPTKPTIKRFEKAKLEYKLKYEPGKTELLAITPHKRHATLSTDPIRVRNHNEPPPKIGYTQFTRLRPSMFSGAMAAYVQYAMGMRSQISMGYRYNFTHGLIKRDKFWYFVEISHRGVLIAEMKFHKRTTDEKYYDNPLRKDYKPIFDKFGGMPKVFDFPNGDPDGDPLIDAMAKAIQKKRIIRIGRQYQLQPYLARTGLTPGMGWAFSPTGQYIENVGFERGVGQDLLTFATQFSLKLDVQRKTFDGSVKITGTTTLIEVSTGPVYQRKREHERFMFKAYDEYEGGLKTVDFTCGLPGRDEPESPPICDHPVFVFFQGDDLKVLRYFRDTTREAINEYEDDYDTCMVQGSWRETRRQGTVGIPMCVYMNDYDPRNAAADTTTVKTMERSASGSYISGGYDSGCCTWYVGLFYLTTYCDRGISRTHIIKTRSKVTTEIGRTYNTAAVIPEGVRDGVVMAELTTVERTIEDNHLDFDMQVIGSAGGRAVGGRYYCGTRANMEKDFDCYNPGYSWAIACSPLPKVWQWVTPTENGGFAASGNRSSGAHRADCGVWPEGPTNARVFEMDAGMDECTSSLAGIGMYSECDTFPMHDKRPPTRPEEVNTHKETPYKEEVKAKFIYARGDVELPPQSSASEGGVTGVWSALTPDTSVIPPVYQQWRATYSALGEGVYVSVSREFDGRRIVVGEIKDEDMKHPASRITYIGVL